MTRMILEADSEWSSKIAKKLRKMSPTSVAITFEQIKRGADLSISEVFKMEYRLGNFQAISILDGTKYDIVEIGIIYQIPISIALFSTI